MNKQELLTEALLDKMVDMKKDYSQDFSSAEREIERLRSKLKEANTTIVELEEKLNMPKFDKEAMCKEFAEAMDKPIIIGDPTFKFKKGDKVRYVGERESLHAEYIVRSSNAGDHFTMVESHGIDFLKLANVNLELIEESK